MRISLKISLLIFIVLFLFIPHFPVRSDTSQESVGFSSTPGLILAHHKPGHQGGPPTPPPPPPPPPPPSPTETPVISSGGGGGDSPTRIVFSGEASPMASLSVNLISYELGNVVIAKFSADDKGDFLKEIIAPVEEKRTYGLIIRDKYGNAGKSKFFTYDIEFNTIISQENIIFAPTILTNRSVLRRGELLLVSGYAAPGNKVEALINQKALQDSNVDVESLGYYRILIDTNEFALGSYQLQTRQIDPESGKTSDVSETRIIKISSFAFSHIDFNDDLKIDIQDWSVFLHNWSSGEESARLRNDLNGDTKVDVSDFAVFLSSFQLAR